MYIIYMEEGGGERDELRCTLIMSCISWMAKYIRKQRECSRQTKVNNHASNTRRGPEQEKESQRHHEEQGKEPIRRKGPTTVMGTGRDR